MLFARLLIAVSLCACLGAAAPAEDKPLTPTEARTKVGESVIVEMTVQAAKDRLEKRGEIYFDSEPNFRDPKNFAAVVNRDGAHSLQAKGIADIAEHFRGKLIRVRGKVTVKDDVPRIEIAAADQIELVN